MVSRALIDHTFRGLDPSGTAVPDPGELSQIYTELSPAPAEMVTPSAPLQLCQNLYTIEKAPFYTEKAPASRYLVSVPDVAAKCVYCKSYLFTVKYYQFAK